MDRIPASPGLLVTALLVAACGASTGEAPPQPATSSLAVACAGTACGASGPGTYSGSGVGVWKHVNAGGSAERVSLSIGGVRAGQGVLLLFSNGGTTSTSLPDAGPGAGIAGASVADAVAAGLAADELTPDAARDRVDAWMVERNRAEAVAAALRRGATALANARPAVAVADDDEDEEGHAPRVGDTRQWWDNWDGAQVLRYTAVARVVCALPGGRTGVLWVDPASAAAGDVTDDDLRYHEAAFCGAFGGYARVVGLRGEPWGRADVVSGQPGTFIQDGDDERQAVHVVFLGVPVGTPWTGYFYGLNAKRRALGGAHATSNESLAIFVNAPAARAARGATASTVLHELTHLVNHYQRSLVRQAPFDTWLEEMSAMMTEDLVTPAVTPDAFQKIPGHRILPYVHAGGGISLTDWTGAVGANPYPAVGTLGAFLNRRYGPALYRDMMGCPSGVSGVGCVTSVVLAAGGTGFADELARMGTSIYGLLPLSGRPAGYGFPERVEGGYTLAAVDVAAWSSLRPAVAAPLGGDFDAASHWYELDTVAAGRTTYERPVVVVPPGVTLLVVIQ